MEKGKLTVSPPRHGDPTVFLSPRHQVLSRLTGRLPVGGTAAMPRRAFGDEPNKGFLATFRERLAQNAAKDKRLQADLDELRKMKEASEAFKKAKEEVRHARRC